MKMKFNEKTKMFEYRGHEIFPLERANGMPSHVIRSYYADEKQRIDRLIELEELRKKHEEEFKNLPTVEEDIDYFLNIVHE